MALRAAPIAPVTRRRRRLNYGYLFVLPYVLLLLAFGVGPSLYAIGVSFSDPNSSAFSFNGVANYATAFRDFRFLPAFENVFLFLIIWLPAMAIGVLLLALLLHARPGRFTASMRLIYYLPGAVVGSASVLLWLFMLDPSVSPFAPLLTTFGFHVNRDILDSAHMPLVLSIIAFSAGAGGWIVIMYGAFQNIPPELSEAAKIDGCNALQSAFYVKLPLVNKYIVYMLVLSFAGGVQLFVEPQLIGKAANGTISPTWSPNELSYTFAFTLGNFGSSAAVSMVLLVIALIAAALLIFGTDFFDMKTRKD